MNKSTWVLVATMAFTSVFTSGVARAAEPDSGPSLVGDRLPWPRWQARVSLLSPTEPWRLGFDNAESASRSVSVLGDYYFGRNGTDAGANGGFRATSGLIMGPRSRVASAQIGSTTNLPFSIANRSVDRGSLASAGGTVALPYLGIGYTNLSPREGWGFSADLGLIAPSTGDSVRLGGAVGSGFRLGDGGSGSTRPTPHLQVGMSYSF